MLQARRRLRPGLHRQREPALGADGVERDARTRAISSRAATATAGSGSIGARPRASRSTARARSWTPSATARRPIGCRAANARKTCPRIRGPSIGRGPARISRPLSSPCTNRTRRRLALFDDNNRFVGAIGVSDVLQAILRRKAVTDRPARAQAGLLLQDNVAERLAAAGQYHAGVDLPLADAPGVVHDDIARQLLRLAGAAHALGAGKRQAACPPPAPHRE